MISVVIPTYNRENYIAACIESVIGQTYKDKEIIVVDDGSRDNTREVVSQYEGKDSFKYIRQDNRGVSAARNRGIAESRGDYIAFLDSDDLWLPDHLNVLKENLEKFKNAAIAFSDFDFFGDGGDAEFQNIAFRNTKARVLQHGFSKIGEEIWLSNEGLLGTFFNDGFPFRIQGSLITRKFLVDNNLLFDENVSYTEEAELVIEAAVLTRMVFVDRVTVLIRRHSENLGDGCYHIKKIESYRQRIRKMRSYFRGKLSPFEKKSFKYAIWEMQNSVMLEATRNRKYLSLMRESYVMLKSVPTYMSLKSIVKRFFDLLGGQNA